MFLRKVVFISLLIGICGTAFSQTTLLPRTYNFYSFSKTIKVDQNELQRFSNFKNHPEYGSLAFNSGCTDCYEVLEKRTADERFFLKNGSNGKEFFIQKSYTPMHFQNAEGEWLTIDPRIKPCGENIFKASQQVSPTEINLAEGFTSIVSDEKIIFNKNVSLLQVRNDDFTEEILVGDNKCFSTAGDDGVEQRNFFPGIYRQMIADRGSIKTNYVFIRKPELSDEIKWLAIKDEWDLPPGYSMNYSDKSLENQNGIYSGEIIITDKNGVPRFTIGKPAIYDADETNDLNHDEKLIGYQIEKADDHFELKIFVSAEWLIENGRDYPVTIDPLVSVIDTYASASYGGSGYANNAFTNYSCTYPLTLMFPAGAQATQAAFGVYYSTGAGCTNSCWISHGALDLVGPCGISNDPSGGPWSCYGANFPGNCYGNSIGAGVLINCLPPSCVPTPVTITLRLMRKYCAGVSQCDNSCIRLNPNTYTVTLQGITLQASVSSSSTNSCAGAPVTLTANPLYGVAPYTYSWNPGGLSGSPVTVNPLVNTTYTLITTDACGNTVQSLSLVNILPTATASFTAAPTLLCINDPVNITYTGNGNSGATYNWNFAGATIISGSGSGPYVISWPNPGTYNVSLTVTQGACTSQPYIQTITVGAVPTSTFTIGSPQCLGQLITITFTGTAPPTCTYNWNFGGGTIISGSGQGPYQVQWNTAGNHNVTLQVFLGSCSSAITTNVAQIQNPPTATIVATSPTCSGQNTLISYSGNGGSGATYNWNFAGGTIVSGSGMGPYQISWAAAGTYSIQLTVIKNGCSTTAAPVNVIVNPTPSSSFSLGAVSVCINSPDTITYTGGASASATYTWTFGTGATIISGSGQGPYVVSWSTSGNKQVKLTVTENGCTSPQSLLTVSVTTAITSTFSVVTPVCLGQNSTITYTGNAGPGATYTWNFSGGIIASGSGQGPYQVHWNGYGNHHVTLVVTQNGCTSSMSIDSVHMNSIPPSNFVFGTACVGLNTSITYTGNAGPTATYNWNFGGGTVASGSGQGPYQVVWNTPGTINVTLTVTTAQGCTGSTTHSITVIQPPTSDFVVQSPGCAGIADSIIYTGNANPLAPYNWYFGGGTIITSGNGGSGPWTISYPIPGTFTITLVVNDFGCPSQMTTHTVDIYPIPDASFTINPTAVCVGTNATISYSGSSPPTASYNWNFGGGTIVSGSGQGPYQVNWSTSGAHTISLAVTDTGCTSPVVSHTINVAPGPLPDFTTTSPLCEDDISTVTFIGSASGAAVYNWNFGFANVLSGTGSGPYQLSFPSSGSYPVTLTVTDLGCSASTTQNILVNPVPTSTFLVSPDSACQFAPVTVNYAGTGNSFASYNWNFGGGTVVNGTGAGPYQITFNDTGIHSISLAVTQQFCTSDTQEIIVHVDPSPSPDFTSPITSACDVIDVPFENTSSGAISYLWNFGDGSFDTSANPSHHYDPGQYDVSLTAFNVYGCSYTITKNDFILVQPSPHVQFTSTPAAGLALSLEEAQFVFENLSTNATSYLWTFGDGDSSGLVNPVHTFLDTGKFQVTVIAYNDVGCSDSVTVGPYIIVPADLIFIPNAFTPNNDGRNDVFRIYGKTIMETDLKIFDRWGELVYSGDGYKDGWNGTFKNQQLNSGVFVYRAVITKNSGTKVILQGDLNLIR